MTLEQYILNPAGKNNAVLNATAREAMRNSYMSKYNNLLVREHGSIVYRLYKDEKNNRYFAYFKIPSETIEKFYYDTVLEFYADKDVDNAGTDLLKYNVRFFSNDPAFTFTYAYVFYHNNLFINELKGLMSKEALKKAATEKNPNNQVGYVKTIYFAYLTLKNRSLNRVEVFKPLANNLDMSTLKSLITDTDTKIANRIAAGEKLTKNKKKQKEKRDSIINKSSDNSRPGFVNKIVNSINSVKTTGVTKSIGKTKTTKFSKKK